MRKRAESKSNHELASKILRTVPLRARDVDSRKSKFNKTFQVEKTRKTLLETVKNRIDQLKLVTSPNFKACKVK